MAYGVLCDKMSLLSCWVMDPLRLLELCVQIRCRAGDTAGIVPFNGGKVTCFTRRAVASGLALAHRGRVTRIQGKRRRPVWTPMIFTVSGWTVEQNENGGKWWVKAYPQPSRLLEYLLYHTSPWILRWIFEDSLHWHLYGRNATSRGSPGLISASSKASMVVRQKGGARPPWTLALPLAGTTGPRHAMP